jgi:hypothetical protein
MIFSRIPSNIFLGNRVRSRSLFAIVSVAMDNSAFKLCKAVGHQCASAIYEVWLHAASYATTYLIHPENGRGGIFIAQDCKMRVLQERNLGSTVSS